MTEGMRFRKAVRTLVWLMAILLLILLQFFLSGCDEVDTDNTSDAECSSKGVYYNNECLNRLILKELREGKLGRYERLNRLRCVSDAGFASVAYYCCYPGCGSSLDSGADEVSHGKEADR